jgi:hypothetical protein
LNHQTEILGATTGWRSRLGSATGRRTATTACTATTTRSSAATRTRTGHSGCRPFRGNPNAVSFKRARGGEFAQFVAHHIFRDVHGNEFLAVMDGNRVPDHFRKNGGPSRPGLHHFLFETPVQELDLLDQVAVYERPFF